MPKLYILVGIVFFVLINNCAKAQALGETYKTFIAGDTSSIHLIKQTLECDSIFSNLFNVVRMDNVQADIYKDFQKSEGAQLLKQFNGIVKQKNVFEKIYRSTTVNLNYYFTSEDTVQQNNTFMNATVSTNFNFMGMPLTGQFSAVFLNDSWQSQWSSGGINFDITQYKQTILEKLSMNEMKKHFSYNAGLPEVHLKNLDYEVLLTDAKYTAYNAVINNPKFSEIKYEVTKKIDSIVASKDSSFYISSTKDSLLRIQKRLLDFEQKYQTIWSERGEYVSQAVELKNKLQKIEGNLTKLKDPEFIKNFVGRSKVLSLKEKLMYYTKDFSLGRFSVDEDEFTIKNQLLAGFKTETELPNKVFGIVVGTGAYAAFSSPVFYNPFQQASLGKRFVHLKYGFITPDSGKIIFRFMNAHRTSDTAFNTVFNAPDNSVIDVSYLKNVGTRMGLVTSVAYSHTGDNIGLGDEGTYNTGFFSHVAAIGTLYYNLNKYSKLGIGYFYYGSDFTTFGNDFLVNNRNGVKADVRIGLLKNKLSLKAEIKYGKPNNAALNGLSQSTLQQISTEVNWNIGKGNFIQFRYMPNTFTQNNTSGTNAVDYRSNIYLLTGSFNYKTLGLKQFTNVSFSNINQQVQFFDSLKINQTTYMGLNQRCVLNEKNSIDIRSQLGYASELRQFNTGYLQVNDNFSLGKNYKFSSGLQASKRVSEDAWRLGLTANTSLNLGRLLNINTGLIYRFKPLNEASQSNKSEWLVNSSATLMF